MANLDARKRRKNQGRDGTSEIQCARPATPRFALSKVQDTWSNVTDSQARKLRHLTIVDQGVNAYLKGKCIRVTTPLTLEDARRLVAEFVDYYNTVRLHSAIAYITPADKLAGRAEAIWAARREKLARADARRRAKPKEKEFARS